MSWTYVGKGTTASNGADASFSGGLPASYTTGDLLLALVTIRLTSETVTSVLSGVGGDAYTLLASDPDGGIWLYGKVAGASETAAYVTRSGTSRAIVQTAAFRDSGGVKALGSIVHVSADSDIANNTNATLTYPSATITVDNCLVIVGMTKNKGVDEETLCATVTDCTEIDDNRPNFTTSLVSVWDYQIQTTAASITGSTVALTTWTESSTRPERAITVALLTNSALYVKLLAPAAAASAASIEGVVLNAARDTVVGEFTGQAFEAALEGGEAVLLIPCADITPDGGDLTTSDTPLVVAYNTTHSTDLASATVVEV